MSDLQGFEAELFESFRALGLSVADARAAATDPECAAAVGEVTSGLAFGRLSLREATAQLRSIGERAPGREPQMLEQERLDAADYELTSAAAFGRRPAAWAVEVDEARRKVKVPTRKAAAKPARSTETVVETTPQGGAA